MPPRTIAVGDIHGCFLALDAVLEAIKPRPEDTIVTLGDYIDRGPDSQGVLERLIELNRRCQLVPILGNHDQILLDVRSGVEPFEEFLGMDGGPTLDSYGPGRPAWPGAARRARRNGHDEVRRGDWRPGGPLGRW
jgi:serine/threonine protein phosphatase 1